MRVWPGVTQLLVAPVPCRRRASSSENRPLASLEWLYPLRYQPSPERRANWIPPAGAFRWSPLPSTTTRPCAATTRSSNCSASRKCPRWLTTNCFSNPSTFSQSSSTMPALQTSASRRGASWCTCAAQSRTERTSARSSTTGVARPDTLALAALPLSDVRAVPITCAPRNASTRIVSRPIPELQPVTGMVLPRRSRPAVACSAVEPADRPAGAGGTLALAGDGNASASGASAPVHNR